MIKYLNGYLSSIPVPEEQTLVINVNTDQGQPLLQHLPIILKEYSKYVSCFCLMGGDQDQFELKEAFKQAHKAGLKTCLYTGLEEISQININLLKELDYIKLGRFVKSVGPLNNPNTNQKMFMKDYSPFSDTEEWIDITYKFWPKEELV